MCDNIPPTLETLELDRIRFPILKKAIHTLQLIKKKRDLDGLLLKKFAFSACKNDNTCTRLQVSVDVFGQIEKLLIETGVIGELENIHWDHYIDWSS